MTERARKIAEECEFAQARIAELEAGVMKLNRLISAALARVEPELTAAHEAGRREGLEQAAKIAEAHYAEAGWNSHYKNAGFSIAAAIREARDGR